MRIRNLMIWLLLNDPLYFEFTKSSTGIKGIKDFVKVLQEWEILELHKGYSRGKPPNTKYRRSSVSLHPNFSLDNY